MVSNLVWFGFGDHYEGIVLGRRCSITWLMGSCNQTVVFILAIKKMCGAKTLVKFNFMVGTWSSSYCSSNNSYQVLTLLGVSTKQ